MPGSVPTHVRMVRTRGVRQPARLYEYKQSPVGPGGPDDVRALKTNAFGSRLPQSLTAGGI